MREERVARLLDAVLAVTGDLQLESVLARVIESACAMVEARYGALGVLADDGQGLSEFVTTGIDDAAIERIGRLPEGRGILGVLIAHPEPLRLDDLKDHPASFGFPRNHPPMNSFLGAPIRVRDEVFGNLYLTEKVGGRGFTADDEQLVVGLAAVAGAAIANARLVGDLHRRDAWRSAVMEVTTSVLSGDAPDRAHERVSEAARTLIGGTGAAIVAAAGGSAQVIASVGDGPPIGPVPAETPVAEVLAEGVAVTVEESVLFPGCVSWVPLRERDEVVAALGVGSPQPIVASDAAQLALFAAQASLALAHGRVSSDLRRLERIEDRERIGRDLHDTVIQRLFATGLGLQALARRVEDRPEVAERLARAVDDVDATVKEIRSTIFALQAPPEVASVRGDILRVADEIASMLKNTPRVRFEGPIDTVVSAAVAEHLVPVVREALTNVARHADAERVEVHLAASASRLELLVRDDGVGGVEGRDGGFGLGNIRDRARSCGGGLDIGDGLEGRGTEVRWWVPL
ncbi:GAF domain-containing sensor histidine kinase [Nitriliruptor alkaliphilus]|uniref:GAF domain-containing sensor histidine kinase n=1 Tax=Nitriliruptor alkaliphilus TaxID=427918 RepID=UPI000A755807|nr:GAF domain-containing sensor histidine kinase [Nitriliruptor alkaliphilus]